VLAAGGPRLILGLPAAALRPELEPAVSAIFRHLLEDPATLQAAMEAEIRSALASWAGGARGGAGAGAYDGAPPAAPALPEFSSASGCGASVRDGAWVLAAAPPAAPLCNTRACSA
jgi:hypothetical protein